MLKQLWTDYINWYLTPFKREMDATGWFLFVGLILLSGFVWSVLLGEFVRVTKEQ